MRFTYSARPASGLLATAAAVSIFALAPALTSWQHADAGLQAVADEAALAGVSFLGQNVELPKDERIERSIAATQQVGPKLPERQVRISADLLAVTVTLPAPGKPVSATARYIPPRDR